MTQTAAEPNKIRNLVGVTFHTLQRLLTQLQSVEDLADVVGPQLPQKTLDLALHAVTNHPESTASELALSLGETDSRHIGRRLSDLARRGVVVKGTGRRCNVTGRKAATWSLAPVNNEAQPVNNTVGVAGTYALLSSGGSSASGGNITITGGVSTQPTLADSIQFVNLDDSVVAPNARNLEEQEFDALIRKMGRGEQLTDDEFKSLKHHYSRL